MSTEGFKNKARRLMKNRIIKWGLPIAISLAVNGGYWLYRVHISPPKDLNATPASMVDEVQANDMAWRKNASKYSTLLADIRAGNVAETVIQGDTIYVTLKAGGKYTVGDQYGFATRELYDLVTKDPAHDFGYSEIKSKASTDSPITFMSAASMLLQTIIAIAVMLSVWPMIEGYIPIRSRRRKGTGVSFDDVIGCAEAKQALLDVTMSQRHPERYAALGVHPHRGVLLTGAPGTGKTQLAKALATESGINFISATGSDFSSMFMGVGILKVRRLFRQARKLAPCILFIDEIDSIGQRTNEPRMGEAEQNRIVNQLLTEMDGFDSRDGVLVIAATNLPESLDPALRREGRLDRIISVPLPTLEDRKGLLNLYLGKIKTVGPLDIDRLAGSCMGLSPAAIAAIVNHSGILAAREGAEAVEERHVVSSIDTNRIGEQSLSVTPFTDAERRTIAVHEAGHAVIAALLAVGHVDKVTILPRGQALGATVIIPVEDKRMLPESDLNNQISMLLAGRAAELIYFGESTSGAANDLDEATRIALAMISTFGMSPNNALASHAALKKAGIDVSAAETVEQVNRLLSARNAECEGLIRIHRSTMDFVVDQLLERESIDGAVVYESLRVAIEAIAAEELAQIEAEKLGLALAEGLDQPKSADLSAA